MQSAEWRRVVVAVGIALAVGAAPSEWRQGLHTLRRYTTGAQTARAHTSSRVTRVIIANLVASTHQVACMERREGTRAEPRPSLCCVSCVPLSTQNMFLRPFLAKA